MGAFTQSAIALNVSTLDLEGASCIALLGSHQAGSGLINKLANYDFLCVVGLKQEKRQLERLHSNILVVGSLPNEERNFFDLATFKVIRDQRIKKAIFFQGTKRPRLRELVGMWRSGIRSAYYQDLYAPSFPWVKTHILRIVLATLCDYAKGLSYNLTNISSKPTNLGGSHIGVARSFQEDEAHKIFIRHIDADNGKEFIKIPKEPADLKVVQYIGSLGPGGSERQLLNLCKVLKKKKFYVKALLALPVAGEMAHYNALFESAGIPVKTAGEGINKKQISLFNQKFLESDNSLYELTSSLPPHLMHSVIDLVGELLINPPHILHCWLDHTSIIGGIAGYITGVPRIVLSLRSVNPTHFPSLNDPWIKGWYKVLSKSKRVVFINNSVAGALDYTDWLGFPNGSIKVVFNGIDFDSFSSNGKQMKALEKEIGADAKTAIIGGVFRLSSEKRPFDFLETLTYIEKSMPRFKAVIAGTGPMRGAIKKKIKSLGLDGKVILLGRREDVLTIIKSYDIILHTSENEGTPNVLLEAQYLEVPVVATAAGGTVDTVEDGISGFLHKVGDTRGMAESALKLLENKNLANKMGKAGRAHVKEKFSLKKMVENTIDICYHP